MRGSREDLPATIEADEAVIREAEWADIHVGFMEAGTEIVEFSPRGEYRKTMAVAERTFAAMQAG